MSVTESNVGKASGLAWLAPIVGLAAAWGTWLLSLKLGAPYGGGIGQFPSGTLALLFAPASAAGAALAGALCVRRHGWTYAVYLVGGAAYAVILATTEPPPASEDAGPNMAPILLPVLHLAAGFLVLELATHLKAVALRVVLALVFLGCGALAGKYASDTTTLVGAAPEAMKASLGKAFAEQALNPLLAKAATATWSEHSTTFEGSAETAGRYTVEGALSDGRGGLKLSGIDATNVHFRVTLKTQHGFDDPNQEDLKAKLPRIKKYLAECGVSEAVIEGVTEQGIIAFQRWTSHPKLTGENEVFLTPGDKTLIIEGTVLFNAALQMKKE